MSDLKGVTVKMNLVADVNRRGEGARVVKGGHVDVKPRVDIKSEVETGNGAFSSGGNATTATGGRTVGNGGASVKVGAGGGVLGHLLAKGDVDLPDPEKMSRADLKKLLTPHFGQAVVVTSWDRDGANTLAEAVKKQTVGDTRGVLVNVNDDGIVLKKDGKELTVNAEFWAIARVKLEDGPVVAADPSYAKHYTS